LICITAQSHESRSAFFGELAQGGCIASPDKDLPNAGRSTLTHVGEQTDFPPRLSTSRIVILATGMLLTYFLGVSTLGGKADDRLDPQAL
jgi:hypothetical protein